MIMPIFRRETQKPQNGRVGIEQMFPKENIPSVKEAAGANKDKQQQIIQAVSSCLGVQQDFWRPHWGNDNPPCGMLSDDVFIKKTNKKKIKKRYNNCYCTTP